MFGLAVTYDRVPYFYTDQFDLGREFSNYGTLVEQAKVIRRLLGGRRGRVVAGMNVNVWDVNPTIEALIASGRATCPA